MTFKEQPEKFTLLSPHNTPCQDNFSGQTEAEIIEAQLEALTHGLMKLTALYTSFIQELVSEQQSNKCTATTTDVIQM